MTRYDTEALRAEAREIESRIGALEKRREEIRSSVGHLTVRWGIDILEAAIDSMDDELGPLRSRLDEIEEDLSFAEAAEDNRERQPR